MFTRFYRSYFDVSGTDPGEVKKYLLKHRFKEVPNCPENWKVFTTSTQCAVLYRNSSRTQLNGSRKFFGKVEKW
jgi:hypothetical protein